MKWVHPNFLYALTVILIPLIIHLFHFKRYKTLYFSSTRFLQFIEQQQQNARKLKYWIIFLCRAIAFAGLVIAFAQPYFPLKEEKAGKQLTVIYVDNSYSMSRLGENGELLAQSKDIVNSVVSNSPRKAEFLLLTNELSGSEKQLLNKTQCLEKIEQLDYTPLHRSGEDIQRWFEIWKSDALKNGLDLASTKFILLSDFQRSTFNKLYETKDQSTIYYPVSLTPVQQANLYIDSVWFEQPIHKLDAKETIFIRVNNTGDLPVNKLDVNLKIGGINRDVFADVPAFGSDTVSLSFFNTRLGNQKCVIRVNDKQMTQDDSFYFNYSVFSNENVLIVNGEDAISNVETVYNLDAYYKVKTVSQTNFSTENLKDYSLVVLNGSRIISTVESDVCLDYLKNKGSIFLIPGKEIRTGSWNNLLSKINLPLISGEQTSGLKLKSINAKEPFFSGVFDRKPDNLNLPDVKIAYRLQTGGGALATDLMSFENGAPFLLKGTSNFNVYLLTTSLTDEYSSFKSNALFSTVLLRIGELSQKQLPYFLTIGKTKQYPVEKQSSENAIHIKNQEVDFIPTTYNLSNQAFISIQGLEAIRRLKAGIYAINQGKQLLGQLALNYDRTESETKSFTIDEIDELFKKAGLQFINTKDLGAWTDGSILTENLTNNLWKYFAILALCAVITEMLIIVFWKKR